jgi:hypothetical protein
MVLNTEVRYTLLLHEQLPPSVLVHSEWTISISGKNDTEQCCTKVQMCVCVRACTRSLQVRGVQLQAQVTKMYCRPETVLTNVKALLTRPDPTRHDLH